MYQVEKRRMCPNCRAFITTDDRVCPYCDMQLTPTYRQRTADIGGFIPRDRFTTTVILLINSGFYLAIALLSMKYVGAQGFMDFPGQILIAFGAKEPYLIHQGQWWRYVTAGFLHAGLIHFAMNSWVLFDLGREVEQFFGTARFLVIYFVSSVAGFVVSNMVSNSLSIGASAAIFGLIGAMIGLGTRSKTPMGGMIRSHFGRWALYGLLMSVMPFFAIDLGAHVGGLAAGFIIGYLADQPRLVDNAVNRMWKFAAVACVIITACSFALVFAGLVFSLRVQ
jgi:rhomboid protease GluP